MPVCASARGLKILRADGKVPMPYGITSYGFWLAMVKRFYKNVIIRKYTNLNLTIKFNFFCETQ